MENKLKESTLNQITDDGREYLYMKIDQVKLKSIENLSVLTNKMVFILIATMLGGVILQLLGFAASFYIGQLLGSYALGFVVVASFFIITLGVVYICRNRLFTNVFVQTFVKMFFPKPKDEEVE